MTDHCAAPQAEPTQSPREHMNLTFGLALDGFRHAPDAVALGELTCGPAGILGWLEARLGLVRRWPTAVERLMAYERALAAASTGSFYFESFDKDPLAVAETLLGWRDELILSGWSRNPAQTGALRPDLLFELEARVNPAVRTGMGDRVLDVLAALSVRPIAVESLVVVDERSHVPVLWQQLLDALGAQWPKADQSARPVLGPESSDLFAVQTILSGRRSQQQFALKGDGTLTLYSAYSEITLGRIAGQELEAARRVDGSSVLLADASADQVDVGLAALDEPTAGLEERSRARAIPQVLALALRLRWQPLNPAHLMEFLTHPVCPVGSWLRRELAKALQEAPGIGGPKWKEAIQEAQKKICKHFAAEAPEREKELTRLEADLQDWVMVDRFDHDGIASGSQLAATCSQVAQWSKAVAAYRKGQADEDLYLTLTSVAQQLGELLAERTEVRAALLDRLLGQVLGAGWLSESETAELGDPRVFRHAGALFDPVDVVVWWGAVEPAKPRCAPWTTAELEHLKLAGIAPMSVTQSLARESRAWERMVLAIRRRLILLLPQQQGGETSKRHPLLNRLQGLLGKTLLPIMDVDSQLRVAQPPPGVTFKEVPGLELPSLLRWWRLPEGCSLPARAEESFSSAEQFLYRPYHWVLKYPARLRQGILSGQQLHADSRLHGNLLHRLTEWLFNEPPPLGLGWRRATQRDVQAWVRGHWKRLLETEGATLLVPGYLTENARLRVEAELSMWELISWLHKANVVSAVADHHPDAQPFAGGTIDGHLDLFVTNAAGRKAVLDLKYGGRADKESQMDKGIPLQLAVYAYLLAEGGRQDWPAAGFFVLKDQVLLTRDHEFFPGFDGDRAAAGRFSWAGCWREFGEMWSWRRGLLDQRWIEVTVDGTRPTDGTTGEPHSVGPLSHWKPGKDHNKYNDFRALTGFGVDE